MVYLRAFAQNFSFENAVSGVTIVIMDRVRKALIQVKLEVSVEASRGAGQCARWPKNKDKNRTHCRRGRTWVGSEGCGDFGGMGVRAKAREGEGEGGEQRVREVGSYST